MPRYAWEDPNTGDQWETDMKYEEMLEYKQQNPELTQIFEINFVSSRHTSGIKNDDGWNEMMSRIGEAHPDSEIGKQHRKKTSTEIKTREAISKNRKRLGLSDIKIDSSAGISKHGTRSPDKE